MRAISGLWRWRHNPLRRTTDLVEAWVALAALLLVLVAAPVLGSLAGFLAQDALQQSVREQRQSRHPVAATVVRILNRPDPDPEITTGRELRSRVLADWTAPDGTRHHGPVTTSLRSPHPGDHFTLWTDGHGRTVTRPLDSTTATTHAVLAGCGAGMLTVGLVEGIRRLIVWRLVRRRYARWDQAWDRTGPDWGRTGTGS
ncbi:Rv1733c family protein [Streptomyces sp. NPDC001312]|uniref:Rv1733c family protein n=1 Tax=Streptomyces sp. NPDC001312 TaxID=3364561 RepID=UPI0036A80422